MTDLKKLPHPSRRRWAHLSLLVIPLPRARVIVNGATKKKKAINNAGGQSTSIVRLKFTGRVTKLKDHILTNMVPDLAPMKI